MPIEAEVLQVIRPGNLVSIAVVFRDGLAEENETLSFHEDVVTEDMIRAAITDVGLRILRVKNVEALAKTFIGQKISIDLIVQPPVPVDPPVQPDPIV